MIKTPLRIADDPIYLNENRYQKPKEIFKKYVERMRLHTLPKTAEVLDVGCATGELTFYLQSQFPTYRFTGVDVSAAMIQRAQKQLPQARFVKASLTQDHFFKKAAYDVVICGGVISIFDDVAGPLRRLIQVARPGGLVLVYTMINEDPVDVLMRYRRAEKAKEPWENGWNVFSKVTVERILQSVKRPLTWSFTDFHMPFALPKQKDPLRTWTVAYGGNPYQLVNGACQVLPMKLLEIKIGGRT